MLLVDAEDDGLGHPVAALLQELGDLLGHQPRSVIQHQGPVEILGVVDPVLDLFAFAIQLTLDGPIAPNVAVDVNLDDFVGGEEPIPDALLQGIAVNRGTEVIDVRGIGRFLGRRGQADLRG